MAAQVAWARQGAYGGSGSGSQGGGQSSFGGASTDKAATARAATARRSVRVAIGQSGQGGYGQSGFGGGQSRRLRRTAFPRPAQVTASPPMVSRAATANIKEAMASIKVATARAAMVKWPKLRRAGLLWARLVRSGLRPGRTAGPESLRPEWRVGHGLEPVRPRLGRQLGHGGRPASMDKAGAAARAWAVVRPIRSGPIRTGLEWPASAIRGFGAYGQGSEQGQHGGMLSQMWSGARSMFGVTNSARRQGTKGYSARMTACAK